MIGQKHERYMGWKLEKNGQGKSHVQHLILLSKRNCSVSMLVRKSPMRIWRIESRKYSNGDSYGSSESNGVFTNCLSISYKRSHLM